MTASRQLRYYLVQLYGKNVKVFITSTIKEIKRKYLITASVLTNCSFHSGSYCTAFFEA